MDLTQTQQAILQMIAERIDSEGMPPSQTEIARAFGFKGVRSAQYHLDALEAAGAIERVPGRARGIRLVRPAGDDEPAVTVAARYGESGTAELLVLSQVVLSMQLPFAVIPLVAFTSDRAKMGVFANRPWLKWFAWGIAAVIVALTVKLLVDFFGG